MKAKAYLNQLKKLDRMIENKLFEAARWKEAAKGTASPSAGERVQSSGSKQKMADAIGRAVDLEHDADVLIDQLVEKRNEVISVIEQLENAEEYNFLHNVYVKHKTLVELAAESGNSYSWATTMHHNALKHVQKIIDREGSNGKGKNKI